MRKENQNYRKTYDGTVQCNRYELRRLQTRVEKAVSKYPVSHPAQSAF